MLLSFNHFKYNIFCLKCNHGFVLQATEDEQTFCKETQVGLVMDKDGTQILAVSVLLEESALLCEFQDVPRGGAMLLGLMYAVNIDYPKKLNFELIQKVLMNISGGQCSSVVHGVKNKLLHQKM